MVNFFLYEQRTTTRAPSTRNWLNLKMPANSKFIQYVAYFLNLFSSHILLISLFSFFKDFSFRNVFS